MGEKPIFVESGGEELGFSIPSGLSTSDAPKNAIEGFLEELNSAIEVEEIKEDRREEKRRGIIREEEIKKQQIDAISRVLTSEIFLAGHSEFNDDSKVKAISTFIVEKMGINSPEGAVRVVHAMMKKARPNRSRLDGVYEQAAQELF